MVFQKQLLLNAGRHWTQAIMGSELVPSGILLLKWFDFFLWILKALQDRVNWVESYKALNINANVSSWNLFRLFYTCLWSDFRQSTSKSELLVEMEHFCILFDKRSTFLILTFPSLRITFYQRFRSFPIPDLWIFFYFESKYICLELFLH